MTAGCRVTGGDISATQLVPACRPPPPQFMWGTTECPRGAATRSEPEEEMTNESGGGGALTPLPDECMHA